MGNGLAGRIGIQLCRLPEDGSKDLFALYADAGEFAELEALRDEFKLFWVLLVMDHIETNSFDKVFERQVACAIIRGIHV